MQQVTNVDEHRADHRRLPNEHEKRIDLRVLQEQSAERKRDVRHYGGAEAAELPTCEATAPVAPDRRHHDPGRASLEQRLKDGKRG